jgi:hypothetical protein
MTTSLPNLHQLKRTIRNANILEPIPIATSRAKEEAAEIINIGLALGELKILGASLASPHGVPPSSEGILA